MSRHGAVNTSLRDCAKTIACDGGTMIARGPRKTNLCDCTNMIPRDGVRLRWGGIAKMPRQVRKERTEVETCSGLF
jgi:hypothetical protein